MNKLFSLLLFTLLPFFIYAQEEKLEFRKDVYKDKDYCKTNCPSFYLEVLQANNDSEAAKKINQSLIKTTNGHVVGKPGITYSVLEVIEVLKKDARRMFKDYPKAYAASIDTSLMKKTHYTKDMLTVRFFGLVYKHGMGHEVYSYNYLNFDPHTGEELDLQAIIKNKVEFINFVEKRFRETFYITESNINSTGYRFENDTFRLPIDSAIGFIEDNIIFTYNPYAIGPFGQGVTNLEIPIKEIQHLLKISFE